MVPTDQPRFFDLIRRISADYLREPSPFELESWWSGCKAYALPDIERALLRHQADEREGKHAPKPNDVKRRLAAPTSGTGNCAASDPTGRCEYPGIFSSGTGGDGPWYCPWHARDQQGDEASKWIARSRRIPFDEARAKQAQRFASGVGTTPAAMRIRATLTGRRGGSIKLPQNLLERFAERAAIQSEAPADAEA